jgi:hypothetical protein
MRIPIREIPGKHILLLASLLLFGTQTLRGQSYSLVWWSLTAGGGTSTGGSFSVRGSIGQHDAADMGGGNFSLQGGFWSAVATVQTPGAPTLSVSLTGSSVMIAWPKPADGWVLESTPTLSGPPQNWTPVAQTYQDNGTNLYVTFNAPPGNAFFRLRRP